MFKTYSDLSDTPYFSRELFERVEATMVAVGVDPYLIRYQFVQRTDLEGVPHMLYATVEIEDKTNG